MPGKRGFWAARQGKGGNITTVTRTPAEHTCRTGAIGLRKVAAYESIVCLVGFAAALWLAVRWPGDAPWICDEPALLQQAHSANVSGTLADRGLMGSLRIYYGPLPTWIYQAALLLTHDLVLLVALRAVSFMALLGFLLLRVAALTRLTLFAIPVFLLSPFLWLYSRELWDNSFCILFSLAALLCYLEFLSGRSWAIAACIVACAALLMTHLMSIPLVLAIASHALFFERARLWQARGYAVASLLAVGIVCGDHFRYLLIEYCRPRHTQVPGISAVFFSFSGGQWFSLDGWWEIVGEDWWDSAPRALKLLSAVSLLVHAFVAGGLIIALRGVLGSGGWPPTKRAMVMICLATIGLQTVYFGMSSATGPPHYYNASWFAYATLIWLAVDWLAHRPILRHASVVWAGILLAGIALLAAELHRTQGTRSAAYGPTLANQIAISEKLATLQAGEVKLLVRELQQRPHRLECLRQLQDLPACAGLRQGDAAAVIYRTTDLRNGRLEVIMLP